MMPSKSNMQFKSLTEILVLVTSAGLGVAALAVAGRERHF